ncbi:MAG: hypothetical protein JWP26_451 [Devosia sp.]|nr:hypothetical protein [Devosia sp.]
MVGECLAPIEISWLRTPPPNLPIKGEVLLSERGG